MHLNDGIVQMIAAILSCLIVALVFLLLLRLHDAFREIGFELRQTQRVIEDQTVRIEVKLAQVARAASHQNASGERSEENRRPAVPTLDEIMENLG